MVNMALLVLPSIPSENCLAYSHLYSRNTEPLITGVEVRELILGYDVPPRTMRWRFETKFKRNASGNKDVILKHVLETCKKHNLEPVNISNPHDAGSGQHLDVLFADGEDLMKAWNAELSFDFYGTQPTIVGRGSKLGSDMVAFEIKTLPAKTNLTALIELLRQDERLRQAGNIVDVWSMEQASNHKFKGVVLVLFQVNSVGGVPSVTARTKIPGYFVMNKVAYLVKYAGRPGWCERCRRDSEASFHSIHACPNSKCVTCGKTDHSSVDCELKRKSKQNEAQEPSEEEQNPAMQHTDKQSKKKQNSIEQASPEPPPVNLRAEQPPPSQPLSQKQTKEDAATQARTPEELARLEHLKQKQKARAKQRREKNALKKAEAAVKLRTPEGRASIAQVTKEQASQTPVPKQTAEEQESSQQVSQKLASKQASRDPSTLEQAPGPNVKAQAPKQATEAQTSQQVAEKQAPKAQSSKSQPPSRRQMPENLPKKQLQYIKAMERRLLQLCLEDADADVSKLAQSMRVIALSSDEDDSDV